MKKEKNLELCTKCGACLSVCPSYKIFLSEPFSPRGRNFLLFQNKVHLSFEFCLFCERCKEVCPHELSFPEFYLKTSNLKTSLLSHNLLRFLLSSKVNKLNFSLLKYKIIKFVEKFPNEGNFIIYPSCGVFFFFKKAFKKFFEFLERKKIPVGIPKNLSCCGAPFLSLGLKEEVKRRAILNLEFFEKNSKPILMLCATCLWMFKRVYPILFEESKDYERFLNLAKRIKSVYFFLTTEFIEKISLFSKKKIIFHLPCHLTEEFNLVNTKLEVEKFCCGSAKSFLWIEGFQAKYKKFWFKNLGSFLGLATFCTGCYLTFKTLIKEPPKICHWLEVIL